MKSTTPFLLGTIALALPLPSMAQDFSHFDANHDEFGAGLSVGYFIPTDAKIKSIFGSEIFKFGLDLGPAPKQDLSHFGPAVALLHVSSGGQNVTVLAGLVNYNLPLMAGSKSFHPYFKIGAGAAYADYSFDYNANHFGAKRILPIAQAKVGAIFDKNWELSFAYDWLGSTSGFNFSGLSISLSYTVIRF